MAGAGITGDRLVLSQLEAMAKAAGQSTEKIAEVLKMQRQLFEALRDEKDNAAALKRLQELTGGKAPAAVLAGMTSPWYRAFLTFDPAIWLSKVKAPVLALNGELDMQVIADLNLPPIEMALQKAGNREYQILRLKGLNHLFQHAKTGAPAEYATIEETIAPEVLAKIGDRIAVHTGI